MKVLSCIIVLCFVTLSQAQCQISVMDSPSPQPFYLTAINGAIIHPNMTADPPAFTFPSGENVIFSCPGARLLLDTVDTKKSEEILNCSNDEKFLHDSKLYLISKIKCSSINYGKEITQCLGDKLMFDIGFWLKNKFVIVYRTCYDDKLHQTLYTKHTLNLDNKAHRPVTVLNWMGTKTDDKVIVDEDVFDKLYGFNSMRNAFTKIFGVYNAEVYLPNDQAIHKKNIVPYLDFLYDNHVRSTYRYINSAPQWRAVEISWNNLENKIRLLRKELEVISGTWGEVELLDDNGIYKKAHLDFDNGILPIPDTLWKAVYDKTTNSAIVYLTINNPFIESTSIKHLCTNRCSYTVDPSKGYIYCCEFSNFLANPSFIRLKEAFCDWTVQQMMTPVVL